MMAIRTAAAGFLADGFVEPGSGYLTSYASSGPGLRTSYVLLGIGLETSSASYGFT